MSNEEINNLFNGLFATPNLSQENIDRFRCGGLVNMRDIVGSIRPYIHEVYGNFSLVRLVKMVLALHTAYVRMQSSTNQGCIDE